VSEVVIIYCASHMQGCYNVSYAVVFLCICGGPIGLYICCTSCCEGSIESVIIIVDCVYHVWSVSIIFLPS
jgi:hypothetical protein